MKQIFEKRIFSVALLSILTLSTCYYLFLWKGNTVPAMAHPDRFSAETIIIDAGHGGEDGGAVSPSGTVESSINSAVAKRLDSILGLYGANVIMLREKDVSLHDPGSETLRQKKVSDLHKRVKIIEETPNATLISIHQNTYSGSSKYHGAQVFYASEASSLPFAKFVQETLRVVLDPENGRKAAKIPDTVYLMNHITCRAILVECGFLSNPDEDVLLQTSGYQTKIATALAGAYLGYSETDLEEPFQNEG